jgi:UDP-2,4-diacetamido-2,4,6-trideoxy-beta-L-altropyranose hydrolase
VNAEVVIRVDSSSRLGTGHVMRCLTLADALRRRSVQTTFLSRPLPGNLLSVIEQRGFACHPITSTPSDAERPNSDADANETRAFLAARSRKPQWLVVDHYALDASWERVIRRDVEHVMVIDDLADRAHDCDLLLDQNLLENSGERYRGKVPERATMLLGPRYAVLRPEYGEAHRRARIRSGPIKNVLIFFGGGDTTAITLDAIDAFTGLGRDDMTLDVVAPIGGEDRIRARTTGTRTIRVHGRLESLAALLEQADLVIGAGGTTSWERLCVGVPSLVITIAENQRAIAAELHRRELIRWLGDAGQLQPGALNTALEELTTHDLSPEWSERCLAVIDGNGVERVCDSMLALPGAPIAIRAAERRDEALLLEWANDQVTRANAFSPDTIDAATHARWFAARLADPARCRIFIIEANGIAVSQVRFDARPDAWWISYSAAPEVRGRGFGRRALELALSELSRLHPGATVVGEVKLGNRASSRVFESLHFTRRVDVDREIYTRSVAAPERTAVQ